MTTSEPFRFTLQGPGVAIDREVDQTAALALLQVAFGNTEITSSFDGDSSKIGEADKRPQRLSLREFVDTVGARSNPEKITAFAVYLRDHREQADFSRDDIKGCFRSAGESLPANFPRDFHVAVQNGWISEDHGNAGRYYVTRKGDDATKRRSDAAV